jgi:hypothetical protein
MTMSIQSPSASQPMQSILHPVDGVSSQASTRSSVAGAGDASGALLPEPTIIGGLDIGAEIALLGVRAGRDEQMIQQKTEQVQNNIQDSAEQGEVKEMHKEASDIMSDAVAAGMMQMCQGAMQLAGAGVAASAATNIGAAGSGGTPASASDLTANLNAQSQQQALGGMSTLYGAGATLFTAMGQSDRELDEAQVTAFKAVADRAGQMSQEASQGQTDARSIISNAVQFYQQYVQTKSEVNLLAAGQKA